VPSLHESQTAVREALCDSFNTPVALDILRELVSRTNVYINARGKNLNPGVVENVAQWVGQMLRTFGLGEGESSELGWGQGDQGEGNVNVSVSTSL
jgi:cysteinyl-tRNA synthetase